VLSYGIQSLEHILGIKYARSISINRTIKYTRITKSTLNSKFLIMSNNNESSGNTTRKAILNLSASHYLVGHPVNEVIRADWGKEKARDVAEKFDNVGFTVDPTDVPGTLTALQQTLQTRSCDGVLVGWCTRGHVEFTVLFEKIVTTIVRQAILQPELKVMFSAGPENLVETTVRNFAV
jgi:hypothetical protein